MDVALYGFMNCYNVEMVLKLPDVSPGRERLPSPAVKALPLHGLRSFIEHTASSQQ
jgi:hypothetical protein